MRLKDDEIGLLEAITGSGREPKKLSAARRKSLLDKFTRRGWVLDGNLTRIGQRAVRRHNATVRNAHEPPALVPVAEAAVEVETAGEETTFDADVQEQDGEGVGDRSVIRPDSQNQRRGKKDRSGFST